MKFTYNWLKDFVEISLEAEALAGKLTMAGLEVKGFHAQEGDFVFEVEITSNRPDWLSIIGIAREVGALTGKPLRVPADFRARTSARSFKERIPVSVQSSKDCPLYTAKIIRGVTVGASPDWLRGRLELIGCRSINNLVDITNYVMFTCGEPLHAFDLDALHPGGVRVRRAAAGEKLVTIDGIERSLTPDMLVIADSRRPVALAGIMGGKETEVSEATTSVLLEAAVFDPGLIRRGGRLCGLSSESSYRFERGIDAQTALSSAWLAVALMKRCAGGECAAASVRQKVLSAKKRTISLTVAGVERTLGTTVGKQAVTGILGGLGFNVTARGNDALSVGVPAWRQDVTLPVDLIEEVARVYGYERIPAHLAAVWPQVRPPDMRDAAAAVKNVLAALGMREVITYSLVDQQTVELSPGAAEAPALLNPLNSDQGLLRTSLIPSLVRCVAYNFNQKHPAVEIFEIAKVFSGPASPQEKYCLGMAMSGERSRLFEQGALRETLGFAHLKGVLETLCRRLGIENWAICSTDDPGVTDVKIRGDEVGFISYAHAKLLDANDIKNRVVVTAQFDLENLLSCARKQKAYAPLPRYPGITRDITFVKPESEPLARIQEALLEAGRPLVRGIRVIDYYQGKQVPPGHRSVTISCLYRSDERTLTDAQIDPVHARLCAVLKERFRLALR